MPRGTFMSIREMGAIMGIPKQYIKRFKTYARENSISEKKIGEAFGNAQSINVLERILGQLRDMCCFSCVFPRNKTAEPLCLVWCLRSRRSVAQSGIGCGAAQGCLEDCGTKSNPGGAGKFHEAGVGFRKRGKWVASLGSWWPRWEVGGPFCGVGGWGVCNGPARLVGEVRKEMRGASL